MGRELGRFGVLFVAVMAFTSLAALTPLAPRVARAGAAVTGSLDVATFAVTVDDAGTAPLAGEPPAPAPPATDTPPPAPAPAPPARPQHPVYLTFDDGYLNLCNTVEMVHALGIHATFFLTGQAILAFPDCVRRLVAYGNT